MRKVNFTPSNPAHLTQASQESVLRPKEKPHTPSQVENVISDIAQDPRDQKTYYTSTTAFRRVAQPLLIGGFRVVTKIALEGKDWMPKSGPVILAANHLTNYDVFFLQAATRRLIFFMGKEELFRNPAMDWVIRQLGGFPVYRSAGDEWALQHAEKVLRAGQVLGMFPEGSRSKGKGLKPAKSGVARLALEAGCPIQPVALHGPQYIFKSVRRRRAEVTVTFGEPIYPEDVDSPLELTDRFMFAIAEMLPVEMRGAYRSRPQWF
jgi:1-acyl-sn-glycerol-3-phosphate acyltransferase